MPFWIQDLAWIGHKLVFCSALEYTLLDPISGQANALLTLQEDAISRTLIAVVPGLRQALLLMVICWPQSPHAGHFACPICKQSFVHSSVSEYGSAECFHRGQDRVGILIDINGNPTSSAFTFPTWPSALVSIGNFVLAVCSDGVHVYDLSTSELVQSMPSTASHQPATDYQLAAVKDCSGAGVTVNSHRKVTRAPPTVAYQLLPALLDQAWWQQCTCRDTQAPRLRCML